MSIKNIEPRDKNGLPHGYWECYDNDQLYYKGSYIHGYQHGYFEIYYANGKLDYKGYYINGIFYGLWRDYYNNGYLLRESIYINDKQHGIFINYSEEIENKIDRIRHFYYGEELYKTIKDKFLL